MEPPPPILFHKNFVFGLIYAGIIIFVVSLILMLLSYNKYWKAYDYSRKTAFITGISTLTYTVILFGLRHVYYALLALILSICITAIIANAGKLKKKLVLGVIVCILVAIFNYPIHFKAYYHFYYIPATGGSPWIDPATMEMTWFWKSVIAIWIIDAGVLTLLIFKGAKKWRWRLLYTSMVIALLYICLFTPILRPVFRLLY